jgi:hypothetical protein
MKHPEFVQHMVGMMLEHLQASFTQHDRIAIVEAMAVAAGCELSWQRHETSLVFKEYMTPLWHAALAAREKFSDRVPAREELESAFREGVPEYLRVLVFAPVLPPAHGHTMHGYQCCDAAPGVPAAVRGRARCLGPPGCPACKAQADALHHPVAL